jgi:hypothetical protein
LTFGTPLIFTRLIFQQRDISRRGTCAHAVNTGKVAPSAKEEPMANRRFPDSPRTPDPAPPVDPKAVKRPTIAPKAPSTPPARTRVTAEARRALIAENAYGRAERRGFEPGHENEDWLAAEAEVDALLRAQQGAPQ